MEDKIIQVTGFTIGPPWQLAYLLVGVTNGGQVVMSQGDGEWAAVGPDKNENNLGTLEKENAELRAQLAKCVYALDMMLAVNVVEADKTYGTAYKHCEDAVRAAKEGRKTVSILQSTKGQKSGKSMMNQSLD